MPITATLKTSFVVDSLLDVMKLTEKIFEFIEEHGKEWESEIQVNWTRTSELEGTQKGKSNG